jgi:hypothetical protein
VKCLFQKATLARQKPHWRRQAKSGWVIWRAANQSEDDMRRNHRLSLASLVVVALLTIASDKAADAAVRCQGNFQITNSSQARRVNLRTLHPSRPRYELLHRG